MKLTRQHALSAFIALAAIGGAVWLAMQLEWVEVDVEDPVPEGPRRDSMEQFKRFATRMGAQVSTPKNLDHMPPPGATLVLTSAHWNVLPGRELALRRWVENGGHLWLRLAQFSQNSQNWIPVDRQPPPKPAALGASAAKSGSVPAPSATSASASSPRTGNAKDQPGDHIEERRSSHGAPASTAASGAANTLHVSRPDCGNLVEPSSVTPAFGTHRVYATCLYLDASLRTKLAPLWALDGPRGHVVIRVPVGRGTVTTAMSDLPWVNEELLRSDNALVIAAALQLRAGQQLWLVRTEARPSLLSVLWTHGAPAIVLASMALLLALWRDAVRFGPRFAIAPLARRSMAEQVRGTAAFAARRRSPALHAAQRRALDEAARSRIAGDERLDLNARAAAIARQTGVEETALLRAMSPIDATDAADATSVAAQLAPAGLALLETARRRLLTGRAASAIHGCDVPADELSHRPPPSR